MGGHCKAKEEGAHRQAPSSGGGKASFVCQIKTAPRQTTNTSFESRLHQQKSHERPQRIVTTTHIGGEPRQEKAPWAVLSTGRQQSEESSKSVELSKSRLAGKNIEREGLRSWVRNGRSTDKTNRGHIKPYIASDSADFIFYKEAERRSL